MSFSSSIAQSSAVVNDIIVSTSLDAAAAQSHPRVDVCDRHLDDAQQQQRSFTIRLIRPSDNAGIAKVIRSVSEEFGLCAADGFAVGDSVLDDLYSVYGVGAEGEEEAEEMERRGREGPPLQTDVAVASSPSYSAVSVSAEMKDCHHPHPHPHHHQRCRRRYWVIIDEASGEVCGGGGISPLKGGGADGDEASTTSGPPSNDGNTTNSTSTAHHNHNNPLDILELQKMYILPCARGKGFAKAILQNAIGFAKSFSSSSISTVAVGDDVRSGGDDNTFPSGAVTGAAVTHLYLETTAKLGAACGLYEKFGFARLKAPMGNSGHSHVCEIWMAKGL